MFPNLILPPAANASRDYPHLPTSDPATHNTLLEGLQCSKTEKLCVLLTSFPKPSMLKQDSEVCAPFPPNSRVEGPAVPPAPLQLLPIDFQAAETCQKFKIQGGLTCYMLLCVLPSTLKQTAESEALAVDATA